MGWLANVKGKAFPVLAGVALTASALLIEIADVGPLAMLQQRLDAMFYDVRLKALLSESPRLGERIMIVDIVEKSLQQEGHWTWRRAMLAGLTEVLLAHCVIVWAKNCGTRGYCPSAGLAHDQLFQLKNFTAQLYGDTLHFLTQKNVLDVA